jgi:GT2 family glycosyltransferase
VVDHENLPFLGRTLRSLSLQDHAAWDACLLLDGLAEDRLESATPGLPANGARLRIYPVGSHPQAVALQEGLASLAGEWVAVLAGGDTLSPQALSRVAEAAAATPVAGVIYTDEDQLSPDGRRQAPFFKPDWSPELLLSRNYLMRAFCRRELFSQVLAESLDLEEAIYRSAEQAGRVVHLAAPMLHVHPASAPSWFRLNPTESQVAAHLQRLGVRNAYVSRVKGDQRRVSWPVPEMRVSIIIPTRDNASYLRRCLQSIRAGAPALSYDVALVDSGSQEQATRSLYSELAQNERVQIVDFTGPFNYSAAINLGARRASGEILVFLNNDTEALDSEWLAELARWASRPEIGVVGARLAYPDGTIQHAGIVLGMEGHASHVFGGARPGDFGPFGSPDWYRDYSAVTGACMAMRRAVFEEVGGFDERFELVFSDVDFCLRVIQAGYRVVYTPFAHLMHYEGRTRAHHIPAGDIRLGAALFEQIVKQGDPFYNPNLSYSVRIPVLRRLYEEAPSSRLDKIAMYLT